MAREKILIVEDDDDIRELVRYNLEKEGYRLTVASSGEQALKKMKSDVPDLVVLDIMLPGTDGLTVCKTIKSDPASRHVPVVMLTAKGEDADVVTGLEVGADDYITKPFSPRILLARIRARLRRTAGETAPDAVIRRGDIEIDSARHQVSVKGKPIELTHTEFALLKFLAVRPGFVFSRYQIVDAVRGSDYPVTDRSVDVQVVGLRKKLKQAGACIETVRGVGYRFSDTTR